MASQTVLIRNIGIFLCVFAVLCISGCVTYFGSDGPYEGRVIDKDTRQPIEGAVVHGTWYRAHPGPGGASHSYYDSKEVLTDKDGSFKIEGLGLLILSNMEEMDINVFKAGYTQRYGSWEGLKYIRSDVEWEGNKAIIMLRRMSLEERINRIAHTPSTPGNKEIKLFMREENKENIEIGRPASTLYPAELLK